MRRRFLLRCTPLTHLRPAILGCDPWPRASPMRRRDLITLLGSAAAAWPLAARAQQSTMPVIGFLHPSSPAEGYRVLAFRQGLKDAGFIDGENVAIKYCWADNQLDRLPTLAAELAQRRVAVIVTGGFPSTLAAKAATATIPIVFVVGEDPVRLGLVTSLARPGGNLTGINFLAVELAAKRLELLREVVPAAVRIAVLVNPTHATYTESILRDVAAAAPAMGLQIQVLNASTTREIDAAFATLVSASLRARRLRICQSCTCPIGSTSGTTSDSRNTSRPPISRSWRADELRGQCGRRPAATNPARSQSSKFEFVINGASTARMLGLAVPDKLLVAADEVIE